MIDTNKQYWLLLSPKVYVNHKNGITLLYHTETGEHIETVSDVVLELINKLQDDKNLGAIKLSDDYRSNPEIMNFVAEAAKKAIVIPAEIDPDRPKPMTFLPILNLQRDVDKLVEYGHEEFIGRDILHYLHQLDIQINNSCERSCGHCNSYDKQFLCCNSQKETKELSPEIINSILSQANNSLTKKVNISGGDVSEYDRWGELWRIMESYDYEYHLWIELSNFLANKSWADKATKYNVELLINPQTPKEDIEKVIDEYINVRLNFIIENEEQYSIAAGYEDRIGSGQINVIPFFTGSNLGFFEENIFIDKDDMFSDPVSMRTIFCNQKLNSNYFGVLNVSTDGSVKANINKHTIGNIYEHSLIEMIYKELLSHSSWREVRNGKICSDCLYQYLCPPPSNYEHSIGKFDLCK